MLLAISTFPPNLGHLRRARHGSLGHIPYSATPTQGNHDTIAHVVVQTRTFTARKALQVKWDTAHVFFIQEYVHHWYCVSTSHGTHPRQCSRCSRWRVRAWVRADSSRFGVTSTAINALHYDHTTSKHVPISKRASEQLPQAMRSHANAWPLTSSHRKASLSTSSSLNSTSSSERKTRCAAYASCCECRW